MVPKVTLHEDLRDIERQGERVVSVTDAGDRWAVFTVYISDRTETRGDL